MSDEAKDRPEKTIRVSVDLPVSLVERFDELKEQWGLQHRGAVLERLLETLFQEDKDNPKS
ncbi:ribbon-helix-helix protein, CopG family [Prochlorococcus marinus]|uniref:ribbon-helix-helix protein, CopG family n=1 Tax=Prochlorococcus marinus TaxID=1219 RepID=UPI0022B3FA67|nr:ribbon-helix-helix protein, CopG family [Prochlorococcus marinus]